MAEPETRMVFMVPPIRLRNKAELRLVRQFPGDHPSVSAISGRIRLLDWPCYGVNHYILILKGGWLLRNLFFLGKLSMKTIIIYSILVWYASKRWVQFKDFIFLSGYS